MHFTKNRSKWTDVLKTVLGINNAVPNKLQATLCLSIIGIQGHVELAGGALAYTERHFNGRIKMAWVYLAVAGMFEIAWALGLKYSDGFSKPIPGLLTAIAMVFSIWLLSLAMKSIPLGTAYAVWTGIGAIGVAVLGMVLFGESREMLRVICLFLIIAGIIGLKLIS